MTAARHAVALLLLPEFAALRAVAPRAAAAKMQRMARDPAAFARGALGIATAWLARHHADDGPWTWAVGDAHLGNIAVLATGARRADGRVPVTVDIADVDDEHPAPWSWDVLRLGASYGHAWPTMSGKAAATLATTAIMQYADILRRLADGDALAGRIDAADLPLPMAQAIEDAHREAAPKRHLAHFAVTRGRRLMLRRGDLGVDDPEAMEALQQQWAALPDLPPHTWLDGVRRLTDHGVSSRGRRRWLALVAEAGHHRLLEFKERPASVLSRVVGTTPFPPRPGHPFTIPMGGDPFQRILALPQGHVIVRTRCHARIPLDAAACDAGDRLRAARLHGLLLARFHWAGLQRLTPAPRDLATEAARTAHTQAERLGRHATRLGAHLTEAWNVFRRHAE